MKFSDTVQHYQNFLISDCKRYKVIKYGDSWKAYFKPTGWTAFGQGCRRGLGLDKTFSYKTAAKAKKDCALHLSTFGRKPGLFDKLN